jgi:hypothetical protein
MWTEIRTAPNLIIAEMWKELFEAEGIPTMLLPDKIGEGDRATYRVLIPELKKHLIEDILRKI